VTKIADTNTPLPGGGGNFLNFTGQLGGEPVGPAISGSNVAFTASYATNKFALYRSINGVNSLVADNTTAVPQGTGRVFSYFWPPSISGQNVATYGGASGDPFRIGIYTNAAGPLTRVTDNTQSLPRGGGTFLGFSLPSIENDQTTVFGDSSQVVRPQVRNGGVYRGGPSGPLSVIADVQTPVPAGIGFFDEVNCNVATDVAQTAFFGASGVQRGIYKSINGTLQKVADRNTLIPATLSTFAGFSNITIAISDSDVAFIGFEPDTETAGVYVEHNGTIKKIARHGESKPGGGAYNLHLWTPLAMDDDLLAFGDGNVDSQNNIFFTNLNNGMTTRLIAVGMLIEGKTINLLKMGNKSLDDWHLAFWARFTDGSSGIYSIAVPEPALGVGLWIAALYAASRRRRGS
jgi:hypothetical protein